MAKTRLWTSNTVLGAAVALLLAVFASYVPRLYQTPKQPPVNPSLPTFNSTGQSRICIDLSHALPDCVFSEQHPGFHASVDSIWSSNAREPTPGCILRPLTVQHVSLAVKILKKEYMQTRHSPEPLKFALRSGGHSPEAGFGSIQDGVAIDMSAFDQVSVSGDKQTVSIGPGARWGQVAAKLDPMGLAMVGGRASNVGVGGLVLGGGISHFSPRFGMVCDNVLDYELVLADGSVLLVSESSHPSLWKALKGGSANLGILTRITARTFVSGKIFAGYLFYPSWYFSKLLRVFHTFNKPENFDEFAAGPLLVSSYVSDWGIYASGANLAYTKPEMWPRAFEGFYAFWRLWSTVKLQTPGDAYGEIGSLSPSGMRQFQVTTTVANDLETLDAFNEYFLESCPKVKKTKGTIWNIVFQPLSAAVTRKGSPNVLGLETRHANDTLIVVLMSMSWKEARDDEVIFEEARRVISRGEEFAAKRGTLDRYRYLNYAASQQDPILGYGPENVDFLQKVSRKYDPDGFFQSAKQGHFKLHMNR